jgi:DNA-binding MarR family transcriptional regulator
MVVARLVDQKLVTRAAARGDARKLSISLTASGRNLLRRSPDAAQTRLVSALRTMTRADLTQLSAQLLSLVDIMETQEKNEKLRYPRTVSATA